MAHDAVVAALLQFNCKDPNGPCVFDSQFFFCQRPKLAWPEGQAEQPVDPSDAAAMQLASDEAYARAIQVGSMFH